MKKYMGKKILIVEDEKPIAEALSLKLSSAGYKTFLVHNGNSASAILKKSLFDLIILDLYLPVKDGFFILSELKKMKISTPVLISSNSILSEGLKRAVELGARDYFVKAETTLAEILEKVQKII